MHRMETQMSRTPLSPAAETWSPLYFLAALGAGGLAVTFFMWLMFWVPHPGRPVPVFEDIVAFATGAGAAGQAMVALAVTAIAALAALHGALTVWNLRRLAAFVRTDAFDRLTRSNAET